MVDKLLPYLREIDANRWYTNFGPLVRKLEARLLKKFSAGVEGQIFLTTVSNCTLGLELMLAALQIPANGRVLLPALTFVATATSIMRGGYRLLLSDIDPDNWLLTPEIAKQALESHKFDVVMPVATYGRPQDILGWERFTMETGIPVVIDAAGAFGNQKASRLVNIVLSTHATKTFSTGEGGIVIGGNERLINAVRDMSNFGLDVRASTKTAPALVTQIGTNAKLSEYHAAIGLAALDEWQESSTARLDILHHYVRYLQPLIKYITYQDTPDEIVNSLLVLKFHEKVDIEKLMISLLDKGVETRRWYCPLINEHPSFQDAEMVTELPIARAISRQVLGLPFYMGITEAEIAYVCQVLSQAVTAQIEG